MIVTYFRENRRLFLMSIILIVIIIMMPSCGMNPKTGQSIDAEEYTTPAEYVMVKYNKDNDEGQIPVKWGGEMFRDMPAHTHDLALLSAALCASAGDSDSDKFEGDYYLAKAYDSIGMAETVTLYNFPNKTKEYEHAYTKLKEFRKSGEGDTMFVICKKVTELNKKMDNYDEHCFAIGYREVMIDGENTHVVTISLRGTQSTDEQIGDAAAKPNRVFPRYNAEQPYVVYNYWADYSDKVLQMLALYVEEHKALQKGRVKIVVGGHSLGGGAANLVGAALDYDISADNKESWKLVRPIKWDGPESVDDIIVFTFGGLNVFDRDIDEITTRARKDYPDGEMFRNIHNLFTFKDTFGPKGDGAGKSWLSVGGTQIGTGFKPANGEYSNLRKFGITFTTRTDLDYKQIFTRGDKRYMNHNMPAYTKTIFDKEDNFTGIYEPMNGEDISVLSPSEIPSKDLLNDFLMYFRTYYSKYENGSYEREYDYQNVTNVSNNIMSNLFGSYLGAGPCINYSIYPGHAPEMMYNQGLDPKKWLNNPNIRSEYFDNEIVYAKYSQEQLNWILMNIFNVKFQDECTMVKEAESNMEFYVYENDYNDRNYYKPYGGIVSDTTGTETPEIHRALTDGANGYCFKYSYGDFGETYYAVMELKTIDGEKYWSIYSNSVNMPETLEKYFDGFNGEGTTNTDNISKYVEAGLNKEQIESILHEALFDRDSVTKEDLSGGELRVRLLSVSPAEKVRDQDLMGIRGNHLDDFMMPLDEANKYVSFFSDFRYETNMPAHDYNYVVEATDEKYAYFAGTWGNGGFTGIKTLDITDFKVDGDKAYIYFNMKRYLWDVPDDYVSTDEYGPGAGDYVEKITADLDMIATMVKTQNGKYRLDHIEPVQQ